MYIQSNASLRELISLMNLNQKGVVIVLENNKPVGILTERDIVEILYKGVNLNESIDKYTKKLLVSTKGDRTVGYAINLTIENNIRRVIVTDDSGDFLGIVTQQDLLKYLEEDFYRLTIKVKHILKKIGDLISVHPDETINEVLRKMVKHQISAVAVVENKKAVGIITEKDVLRLAFENIPLTDKVSKYMSSPVDTANLDTALVEVVEVMNFRNIRRLLVVNEKGEAINIVTIRDVVKNLEQDYSKFLERKLRNAKEILNLLPEMLIEVIDTGEERLIIWANDKVISRFGREILDRPVTDFIPRESWDKIYATINKLHKIESIKLKVDDRIFELSGFFIKTEDRIEKGRVQLIIRDITEDVRLSTIDPLTNIYNKRFINEFLMKEIERSKRSNRHFSIVICDLDDFKKINDTHGHLSGDIVLQSFSQLITSTIRNQDVVGRYGGDEFMIILPDATAETAYNIIDRLRLQIEAMEIPILKDRRVKITASFGISTFPDDGMSSDDLLITSDERLYKAKSYGKNKIACS
jgi:diguanylate cyclase (GGDEF)-like protein